MLCPQCPCRGKQNDGGKVNRVSKSKAKSLSVALLVYFLSIVLEQEVLASPDTRPANITVPSKNTEATVQLTRASSTRCPEEDGVEYECFLIKTYPFDSRKYGRKGGKKHRVIITNDNDMITKGIHSDKNSIANNELP